MEGLTNAPTTNVRKQRITKKQSQAFTRWLESNPNAFVMSINDIINEYFRLTNVRVSRMYVSKVRNYLIVNS